MISGDVSDSIVVSFQIYYYNDVRSTECEAVEKADGVRKSGDDKDGDE